ncbi:MAG: o-succinylbenzoate--CoA ligase [Nocardioidaceae bacterium]
MLRSTGSWVSSFPHVSELAGIDASSRVWVPGPLAATMNLFAAVHARFAGASWSPSPDGATHAVLTPALLERHLEDVGGMTVVAAGDRLPAALRDRATGARVCHYYGAAELSFVAWGSCEDDLVPFPGVDVDVRDGKIWVRSPYLCDGYDGEPGALRSAADGFVTVGDLGELREGRLVVHGRQDAVTTGGATVRVVDVEASLRPTADGEVVVLGLPHGTLGAVLAVVLTDPADHPALRDLARTLPPAQRPRVWLHVPELPLTGPGKVDRAALAGLAASGAARRLV